MENDFLLESVQMDCPYCNKIHTVEKRKRIAGAYIKDTAISYDEIYYFCPECAADDENEFVPGGVMSANLLCARDAYRKQAGLLTSKEISSIRSQYGFSQSDFALLLGLGEITITRYESKSIQDEPYDQLMRIVGNDPAFAYECLKKHRSSFTDEKYAALRARIQSQIDLVGVDSIKAQEIKACYAKYDEPSDLNGNRILNIDKLGAMIAFFARSCENLYKVKLMKLLWYADARAFQLYGKSISGLVYQHQTYGALPLASREIIYLPTVTVQEEESGDMTHYHIFPKDDLQISSLSPDEIHVLQKTADRFKATNAAQIVACMHKEDAYAKTEMYQIIPFSLCRTLRAF